MPVNPSATRREFRRHSFLSRRFQTFSDFESPLAQDWYRQFLNGSGQAATDCFLRACAAEDEFRRATRLRFC